MPSARECGSSSDFASNRVERTPCLAKPRARDNPTGPPPTMRTGDSAMFHGAPTTTGTAGCGKHRIQEAGEKVVEFLATQRIDADDSLRFHPDETGVAQHFKMAGGGGLAQSQGNLATVQAIRLGNRPHDFQPSWIAQGKEDRWEGDLIFC